MDFTYIFVAVLSLSIAGIAALSRSVLELPRHWGWPAAALLVTLALAALMVNWSVVGELPLGSVLLDLGILIMASAPGPALLLIIYGTARDHAP